MTGKIKEEQLINLMHCRYVDGLRDMVTFLDGNLEEREKLVEIANKLSTSNVDNYRIKWGREPFPQMVLTIAQDGNILSTRKPFAEATEKPS
mgnify:CR=1 FL=1